jgi:transitional endoplasmic reticulum ATPase
LPEKIVVTEDDSCEWEYKYREAPVGMKQTEVIGVKPRENHSFSYGGGLGISVSLGMSSKDSEQHDDFEKNVPSVTFGDIGGIDDIVQQIREVIELPLTAPAIFEHYHIKPHKGILLYGPPGCGKTLIAKAVANEINAHFISVNGPEILNKYIGQSEANLRKVFSEAKKNNPTIIYFDEFDSISSTRDADGNPLMATVVNQLLTLMDGIDDTSQICAIASTNRIDMIDEAVRRPGRFDYVIEIQRPSLEGCKTIFRIHTAKMPVDEAFDKDTFVSKYLTGCSGAEIAFVASEAAYNSIRRTVDIKQMFQKRYEFCVSAENIILECDFIKAAKTLTDSRKKADTAKYRYNM